MDDDSIMPVYRIQDEDRSFLRTDLGTRVSGPDPVTTIEQAIGTYDGRLFIVGDYAVEQAIRAGHEPDLAIIDHRREREPYHGDIELPEHARYTTQNRSGTVSDDAYTVVGEALDALPAIIEVDGEEDLLGLAVIDHGETGDMLLFGAPGIDGEEGVKRVMMDDAIKKTVNEMITCP